MKKELLGMDELIKELVSELEKATEKEIMEQLLFAPTKLKIDMSDASSEEFFKALTELEELVKPTPKKEKTLQDFSAEELKAELKKREDSARQNRLDAIALFKDALDYEVAVLNSHGIEFKVDGNPFKLDNFSTMNDAQTLTYSPNKLTFSGTVTKTNPWPPAPGVRGDITFL